jgi:hypothetical protein
MFARQGGMQSGDGVTDDHERDEAGNKVPYLFWEQVGESVVGDAVGVDTLGPLWHNSRGSKSGPISSHRKAMGRESRE